MKKLLVNILILLPLLFGTAKMGAQVTMGADDAPQPFSVLELVAQYKTDTYGGLRLPQMDTDQRTELSDTYGTDPLFKGLMIYNTDYNCVEFWNSVKWISFCEGETPPTPPVPHFDVDPLILYFTYNQSGSGVAKFVTVDVFPAGWTHSISGANMSAFKVNPVGDTLEVYPINSNGGSTQLTATITITAGGESKTVRIIHDFAGSGHGTLPVAERSYVGAYWRAEQTGERIIRISGITGAENVGDWSASVVWMDSKWSAGDIVLDTDNLDATSLANRGINFGSVIANNLISDAEDHKLTSTAQSVSGTAANGGNIIFRIGLKSNFADYDEFSNPARYALVLITYNNGTKTQKIYLRQGEGADNVSEVTSPTNHAAVKWSPYNIGNYINVGNAGNIVDYPTKAGFFYQWSYEPSPSTPKPYSPDEPMAPPTWVIINSIAATPSFEGVCPAGYKVPDGGIGSGEQISLVYNASTNSSISTSTTSPWGYYADGYFDRRAIVTSATNETNSAVSVNNDDVAYRGKLVYNPTTNASLFLPASGYRTYTGGTLYSTGANGLYWSGTPNSTYAYHLYVYRGNVAVLDTYKSVGYSVRCVKE